MARRKVRENYKVTKTRDVAGAPKDDEDTVRAASAKDAVTQAMQGDPKAGTYDKVSVEKDDQAGSGPRTTPQSRSRTAAKTTGMAGFESLDYPYHVGVHQSYKALVETLPKKVREGLTVSTRYGRLHIIVPDAKVMEGFMDAVGKKARGRTNVKGMAKIVHNGITESVKK